MRRLLLALLAFAVAAGGAYVVVRRKAAEARAQRSEQRLLPFDARKLTGFTLTVRGEDWVFRPGPDGWRIESPVRDAAGAVEVDTLLAVARQAMVTRVIAEPEALSAYGLDPPVSRLRLEGTGSPILDAGTPTPTEDGLFARVEGRPGVLVLEVGSARPLTPSDPHRLRDPELPGLPRAEVAGIEVRGPAGTVALAREGAAWWIVAPQRLPASDRQVGRLLDGLDKAAIVGFDDRPEARAAVPPGAVTIVLSSPARTRTLVLEPEGGEVRRVRRDDRETVLLVEPAGLAGLPLAPRDLASERLTPVTRYDVASLSYTRDGRTFAARKVDDATWQVEGGGTVPADTVLRLLLATVEAPVTGWEPRAPAGAETARLEYVGAGGETGTIAFHGGEAAVSSVPGVTWMLAGPPPPLP